MQNSNPTCLPQSAGTVRRLTFPIRSAVTVAAVGALLFGGASAAMAAPADPSSSVTTTTSAASVELPNAQQLQVMADWSAYPNRGEDDALNAFKFAELPCLSEYSPQGAIDLIYQGLVKKYTDELSSLEMTRFRIIATLIYEANKLDRTNPVPESQALDQLAEDAVSDGVFDATPSQIRQFLTESPMHVQQGIRAVGNSAQLDLMSDFITFR